jgi:serine protease Do
MAEARGAPGPLRIVFGLLKAGCIVAGLPLTVICLMALVGHFTANGWARVLCGALGGTLVPLFLIDRLLPADAARGRGMISDGLALVYVAVPTLFVGLSSVTAPSLVKEGDRLGGAGWSRIGALAYWIGGASVQPPPVVPTPGTGSGSGVTKLAKPKPDAGLPRRDGKAARPPDGGKAVTPDARPSKLTPSEIFSRYAASVVFVRTGRGGGTGFLIDTKGTIATNSHVIHDASEVEIKMKDGSVVREVELLVEDQEADLALLAIKPGKLPPPLRLGDSEKVTVGEQAVAIGNPLGLEHTLTDGLVSARRVYQGKRWLQISVPLSPGNSGGPLFNMLGEVIGVNTATVSFMAQNLNLAVPINKLKGLVKDTYPNRRSVGATSPGSW